MSSPEFRRRHREERHLCASCRERKAKYQHRGHIRADRQHVLCFQCFRSARERMRARELAEAPVPRKAPLRYELTAREVEHRRRMLAYLGAQSAVAAGCGGGMEQALAARVN